MTKNEIIADVEDDCYHGNWKDAANKCLDNHVTAEDLIEWYIDNRPTNETIHNMLHNNPFWMILCISNATELYFTKTIEKEKIKAVEAWAALPQNQPN